MTVVLELPLPPNLANGRWHWRVKVKKRTAYLQYARTAIYRLGLVDRKWPHVTVRPTLIVWNRMDADNAVARLKWAIDALSYNGVIPDDRPQFLRYDFDPTTGGPYQEINRTRNGQKLVLVITPDG